jgi:hypothetical protein
MPQCAPYAGNDSVYGFCLAKYAGGIPTLEDMLRVCGEAGEWELDCRHGWVSGRMNAVDEFSTEELLGACGQNPDCTFELLDFRPADEPLTQLNLCTQYAGKYARDCAGHAIQRWWLEDPDEEEVNRIAFTPTPYPDKVGYWLGVNVQCYSQGACVGDPHFVLNCEKAVENFSRNPDRCPARTKTPMHPGFRPQDLAPNQPGQNQPGQPGQNQPMRAPGQGGHVPGGQPPQPGQVQPGQNQPGQPGQP